MEHNIYPPLNGPRTESLLQYLQKLKGRNDDENTPTVDYTRQSKPNAEVELKVEATSSLKDAIQELSKEAEKTPNFNGAPTTEDERMALLEKAIAFENGEDIEDVGSEEPVDIWHIFDEAMHNIENCEVVSDPDQLSETSQFLALSFQSDKYPGFVFATIQGSDANYNNFVYQRMEDLLIEMVEQFTKEKISVRKVNLQFHPFDFKAWIQNIGGTVQSFKVEESTISWAYVDREHQPMEFGESPNENYYSVRLNDIKPKMSVPNDLYLYLPSNNKYLVYTREGRGMDPKQHEKLNNKNIQELHVLKGDIEKFKDYKFEKDVSDLVEEGTKPEEKKTA
ncbi:MAG: hypothetical protein R2827_15325 [Bdellovibrionales bacterium]